MSARLPVATTLVKSNSARRSETAAVLHHAYHGHVKMIAASRGDRGVSQSAIYKETEGQAANPLSTLAGDLDRLVTEGAPQRVEFVLRWLCDRFGYDLAARPASDASPADIHTTVSDILRTGGPMLAQAITALRDRKLEPHEARPLIPQIQEQIEQLHELKAYAEGALKSNVRTIKSA